MTRATRADRISALASAAVVALSAAALARRTRERQRAVAGPSPRALPRSVITLAPEPSTPSEQPPTPPAAEAEPEPTSELTLAPEPATVPEAPEARPTPDAPEVVAADGDESAATAIPEPETSPDVSAKAKAPAQPRTARKASVAPARKAAPKKPAAKKAAPKKAAAKKAAPKAAPAARKASATKPKAESAVKPVPAPAPGARRKATPAAQKPKTTAHATSKPNPKAKGTTTTAPAAVVVPAARVASAAPVIRTVERRRTEPIPGRRIRRPHLPKRRRQRRAGLIPAVAMLLAGLALAVPWYRPGFGAEMSRWGHTIDHWSTSAGQAIGHWVDPPAPPPVVVQDPPILSSEPSDPASHAAPLKAGVPQFLSVPLLQVNSPVVPISGNSGELLPPSDPQLIGWWEQGPKPGSTRGTAVLTGHTVHYGGGAFDHLSFLKVGDHFSIQTNHGTIRYVIVHLHKYETGALAHDSSSLFQLSGPPRVLLVTCSGWNGHIYLENTVVTGVPVA